MKKTANRKGANIQLRKYSDKSLFAYIDYVNSVAVELTSGRVYATGGDSGARQVGFDDPIEGTIKLSTQIVPIEFVALACSPDGVEDGGEIGIREKITVKQEGKITLPKLLLQEQFMFSKTVKILPLHLPQQQQLVQR